MVSFKRPLTWLAAVVLTASSLLPAHWAPPTAAVAQTDDWPMFRRSPERSGYSRDTAPIALPLNLTWRYSLAPGDQQYASAVVANRVVYSGSADGKLYALEADTGALRWRYDGTEPIDSTPAIYNSR